MHYADQRSLYTYHGKANVARIHHHWDMNIGPNHIRLDLQVYQNCAFLSRPKIIV
jgi:hypothetical protein